ncbi:nucleotide-diphospho-sugar transferase [Trichoderma asperelloides]|nr:nucleotide-diphospho-sugar transferase [Trichoderma asperelloides]
MGLEGHLALLNLTAQSLQQACVITNNKKTLHVSDSTSTTDSNLHLMPCQAGAARFRVVLANDGYSVDPRTWIVDQGRPNLFYSTRTSRAGFKAGNLNSAVKMIQKLPGGPAPFIAALDANMLVEKSWLRSVASHIVMDERMALVCPSQLITLWHFYNVQMNDPLGQANLVGIPIPGYILRREALKDIGGFPTECLTEDVQTSMNMMARGWKIAYLPTALQYGLVLDTYLSHVKQFVRWQLGGCQIGFYFHLCMFSGRTGLLTARQRLLSLVHTIDTTLIPIIATMNLVTTPFRLALGIPMVHVSDIGQMIMLLRVQCCVLLAKWLHEVHFAVMTNASPDYSISFLRSFVLPTGLGGTLPGFTPTGSIANTLHERSAHMRHPFIRRLLYMVYEGGAWFHLVITISTSVAAINRIQYIFREYSSIGYSTRTLITELLRLVAWPAPSWLLTICASSTPFLYVCFTPSVPVRDKLLGQRDHNGAGYPALAYVNVSGTCWNIGYAQLYSLIIVYTTALMNRTFIVLAEDATDSPTPTLCAYSETAQSAIRYG